MMWWWWRKRRSRRHHRWRFWFLINFKINEDEWEERSSMCHSASMAFADLDSLCNEFYLLHGKTFIFLRSSFDGDKHKTGQSAINALIFMQNFYWPSAHYSTVQFSCTKKVIRGTETSLKFYRIYFLTETLLFCCSYWWYVRCTWKWT